MHNFWKGFAEGSTFMFALMVLGSFFGLIYLISPDAAIGMITVTVIVIIVKAIFGPRE